MVGNLAACEHFYFIYLQYSLKKYNIFDTTNKNVNINIIDKKKTVIKFKKKNNHYFKIFENYNIVTGDIPIIITEIYLF